MMTLEVMHNFKNSLKESVGGVFESIEFVAFGYDIMVL